MSKYTKCLSFVLLIAFMFSETNAKMAGAKMIVSDEAHSKMARAKLVANREAHAEMMPMSKIILYWHQITKEQPKNAEAQSAYEWATFASDVMGMEQIQVMFGGGEKSVVEQTLVWAIEKNIREKSWTPITNSKAKALIATWRPRLAAKFGESSYYFAWVLFQLDEKDALKKTLQNLYAAEFDKVMKLKGIVIGLGDRPPLFFVQSIRAHIDPLSTDVEKKDMDDKMKKMKLHVSKLPESHVVT